MAWTCRRVFFAAVAGLTLFLASLPLFAQELFYRGKTVRLLVN